MKKSIFWNKVLVICLFGCLLGCTYDTNVNLPDSIIEEVNQKSRRPILVQDKTMEVLVEYVKGTPESSKIKVRYKYEKMGLLLKWDTCDVSDDVEVWIIDLMVYNTFRHPGPLHQTTDDDDDDDEEEEEEGEVEKMILNANCNDYKGRIKGN